MYKYGAFSGPYFLVFSPNTGKYGPENTPYLDTFLAVCFNLQSFISGKIFKILFLITDYFSAFSAKNFLLIILKFSNLKCN